MTRTYDRNGETHEIREPDIADDLLADLLSNYYGKDRTYINAARDRILCLVKERDQARNAILAYGKGVSFDWDVLGRIGDLERGSKVLSEQRAELLAHLNACVAYIESIGCCGSFVESASAIIAKHEQKPIAAESEGK